MLRRSSYVMAAAAMAVQAGPAAAFVCDAMLRETGREAEPLSEREILLARSAAAVRAERAAKKEGAWRRPRMNLKGMVSGLGLRLKKPRFAA